MVTRPMPGHSHPPVGIGAIPIKGITLRYPNARFRGDKLFSKEQGRPLNYFRFTLSYRDVEELLAERGRGERANARGDWAVKKRRSCCLPGKGPKTQVRAGLPAGGRRMRTIGPAEDPAVVVASALVCVAFPLAANQAEPT
jgi:hypothetical protein